MGLEGLVISTITISNDMTVELIDHMGGDHSIVRAARVSVKGANEIFEAEKDAGLINYLARERHGSPFEHTAMTFYVKAPIFVFREYHRHRMASYNEMSGRYTELLPEFYIPASDRKLVNVGGSAKPEFTDGTPEQHGDVLSSLATSYRVSWLEYQQMLQAGVANEVARMALPVGIYSQMYVTQNLRSIFNFLSLRTQREDATHVSRPQREIEMVAEQIETEVAKLFPIAYSAFVQHGRVAP